MRLVCFGDSNTYGYDPRSPLGERYSQPWTRLLRQPVVELGQNGREIPAVPGILSSVLHPDDLLVVMLGSNDLLCRPQFTAADTAARMERFLRSLPPCSVLLIAPPPMCRGTWVTEERLLRESAALSSAYRQLAGRLGICFADAGAWDVELSFDGVHFTQSGHRTFAAKLNRFFCPTSADGSPGSDPPNT